jgi:hypothetical protein
VSPSPSGPRSRDWDAATYDRVSDPQFSWALEQLERLSLNGDEVVLDAGEPLVLDYVRLNMMARRSDRHGATG